MFRKDTIHHDATIVRSIYGSHLYGLNTPASDKDYKEVYFPSLNSILDKGPLQHKSITTRTADRLKNNAEDIDEEAFSLGTFLKHLTTGEMIAMDLLHIESRHILENSQAWYQIQQERSKFYTSSMSAYLGYIRKQTAKYGIKGSRVAAYKAVIDVLSRFKESQKLETIKDELPLDPEFLGLVEEYQDSQKKSFWFYVVCGKKHVLNTTVGAILDSVTKAYNEYGKRALLAADNAGIDWKAVSHAYRASYQLRAIYTRGGFTYPLPETDYIMKIKLGEINYKEEAGPKLEDLYAEIKLLANGSNYPLQVDPIWLAEFRQKLYYKNYGI